MALGFWSFGFLGFLRPSRFPGFGVSVSGSLGLWVLGLWVFGFLGLWCHRHRGQPNNTTKLTALCQSALYWSVGLYHGERRQSRNILNF